MHLNDQRTVERRISLLGRADQSFIGGVPDVETAKSSSSMLVILSLMATPLIIEGDLSEMFGVHEEGGIYLWISLRMSKATEPSPKKTKNP